MQFDDDGFLLGTLFQLVGATVRWLFFLGKKPYKVLHESEFLNGVIGFFVLAFIVWLLLRPILRFILHLL
ncbi:MAG: hypothetical protein HYZ43_14570 [Flavobacteriia bacterium]|jgi:large-conductance mechanosensitive channel|nr:hypothetical protein [Flavobacteriia bacterium]